MPEKTTETITRTCFTWRPTKDVPATRIRTAWFEILRVGSGDNQTTSFNMVADTRAAKKGGKYQSNSFENVFMSRALVPIQELGIQETNAFFDPVPIKNPPEWLDNFFELMAGMLEDRNVVPTQLNANEMKALAQAAYLQASTPKAPPTPPPMTGGFGVRKRI